MKQYSPLVSSQFSGPSDSYMGISKTIAKHQEEHPENFEENNGLLTPYLGIFSDRSRKSQELNTASKEFKKFLIEYSQNNKFLPQKEYKIFVWTSNRELLRKHFPKRTVIERIEIENHTQDVTFSIYSTNHPIIIDCVLYLLTKIEDFKEVYALNQTFKHVWTQGLISSIDHSNFAEIANTLGISIFKTPAQLYYSICADDLKLFNLLREVFNKIDTNQSGEIEFSELYYVIRQIQEDISADDIREAIARIDINNDGKISFEEFCFWWKKGRQGAISLSEVALKWAKQLSLNTPETKALVKNISRNRPMIEKKLIKKEIIIKIGNLINPIYELTIEVGKSTIREKLLNETNMKLSLFSKDLWFSIKLRAKNMQSAHSLEKQLKKSVEIIIDSFFSNLMDGKKIKQAIKFSIKTIDCFIWITFILDLNDQYLEPLNKLFFTFDELLISPLNDYINFQLSSTNNFFKIISNGNFFENLGTGYEIKLNTEYWSKFINILLSIYPIGSSFHALLYSFLIASGKFEFNFANCYEFAHSFFKLTGIMIELNNLITPSIESLLALLENNFEDDIEIFSRISNVGLKAMMRSKNLFNNIIINGWTTWAKVLH